MTAYAAGFPHSEISGSKVVCHLAAAYRRLQRLSSPPIAKASTVCALLLDHIPKSSTETQIIQHTANNKLFRDRLKASNNAGCALDSHIVVEFFRILEFAVLNYF